MSEWEVRELGDICEIARGGSPRPIKKYITDDPDGINWVKISDATASNKYIFKTAQRITKEGIKRSREVRDGDFILSNSMSFGRPYIMRTSGCIHDGWLLLRDKSNSFIQDYLYYFLGSPEAFDQFNTLAVGSTVRNLKIESVKTVKVPLPPLPEQKRIVSILDEAFGAIERAKENAQKNLANARELFESYLNRVFTEKGEGWEEKTLNELIERQWITSHLDGNHGGDYPRKAEFVSEGVPYISANCLRGGRIDMSLAKYLTPERASKLRKGIAQDRDVLFAHNATVGPVTILRTAEPKVILGTSLTYYRCDPKHILPEYLSAYMKSHPFTRQYKAVMRQSTRNQVPITKQRTFTHIIPPIEAQQQIAPIIESLYESGDRLESVGQSKLAALDELKQSILQKAFTGQLTAKSPELEAVG